MYCEARQLSTSCGRLVGRVSVSRSQKLSPAMSDPGSLKSYLSIMMELVGNKYGWPLGGKRAKTQMTALHIRVLEPQNGDDSIFIDTPIIIHHLNKSISITFQEAISALTRLKPPCPPLPVSIRVRTICWIHHNNKTVIGVRRGLSSSHQEGNLY